MQFGPGPWKNIPAAEKMAYLAVGGNPVGAGRGRGIQIWGVLMSLSLVTCHLISLHQENSPSQKGSSLDNGCGQCVEIVRGRTRRSGDSGIPSPRKLQHE